MIRVQLFKRFNVGVPGVGGLGVGREVVRDQSLLDGLLSCSRSRSAGISAGVGGLGLLWRNVLFVVVTPRAITLIIFIIRQAESFLKRKIHF